MVNCEVVVQEVVEVGFKELPCESGGKVVAAFDLTSKLAQEHASGQD